MSTWLVFVLMTVSILALILFVDWIVTELKRQW